jgi:glycosyltransferase involved in cell wall biosynthesis
MITVLYIGPTLDLSGPSVVFLMLAKAVKPSECIFKLCVLSQKNMEAQKLEVPSGIVKYMADSTLAGAPRAKRLIQKTKHVLRSLKLSDANVIVVDRRESIFLVLLLKMLCLVRAPVVVRWGARGILESAGDKSLLQLKARLLLRYASKIIVPSLMVKQELVRELGIIDESVAVIPNAVDMDRLSVSACERPKIKKPSESVNILWVGSLSERKDPLFFAAALVMLKNAGVIFGCRIVGDGPLSGKLKEFIINNDLSSCVTLCPATNDIGNAYLWSDLFVCTSQADGFNLTVLEAICCANYVVAPSSNLGVMEDKLIQDYCSLYDQGSVESLFGCLRNSILSMQSASVSSCQLRESSLDIIRRRYSDKVMADEYLSIFRRAAKI